GFVPPADGERRVRHAQQLCFLVPIEPDEMPIRRAKNMLVPDVMCDDNRVTFGEVPGCWSKPVIVQHHCVPLETKLRVKADDRSLQQRDRVAPAIEDEPRPRAWIDRATPTAKPPDDLKRKVSGGREQVALLWSPSHKARTCPGNPSRERLDAPRR